jgi:hypothetical protein
MPTEKRYTVWCSFESQRHGREGRVEPLGGILSALEEFLGTPAVGLAPHHRNLPSFPARFITTVTPKYREAPVPVDLLQDREDHRSFYLVARDRDVCAQLGEAPFFNGRPDDPRAGSASIAAEPRCPGCRARPAMSNEPHAQLTRNPITRVPCDDLTCCRADGRLSCTSPGRPTIDPLSLFLNPFGD